MDRNTISKMFIRTKNGPEEKYLLDWYFGFENKENVYNHILENFNKHNKTIDSKVLEKIQKKYIYKWKKGIIDGNNGTTHNQTVGKVILQKKYVSK